MKSNLKICFLGTNPSNFSVLLPIYLRLKDKYDCFPVGRRMYEWEPRQKFPEADVVIYNAASWDDLNREGQKLYHIHHGVGIIHLSKKIASISTIFAVSEYWKEKWIKEFTAKDLRVVGFPKTDFWFRNDQEELTKKALEFENINLKYPKTILFTCCAPCNDRIPDLVSNTKDLKVNLLIKPQDPVLLKLVPRGFLEKFDHVKVLSTNLEDVTYLYPKIDLVIGAYSSVMREFLYTNKGVIQYQTPKFCSMVKSTFPHYLKEFEEYPHMSPKNIQEVIKEALESPSEHPPNRKELVEKYLGPVDGHVTDRIVEILEKELEELGE